MRARGRRFSSHITARTAPTRFHAMPKPTDIRIVDLSCQSQLFKYRTPVKFGGRVVEDAVVFDVHATVETRDGRRATGLGSMSMGNAWSWPSAKTGGEDTLRVMLHLAEQFATQARDHRESGHPLDITQELATLHQPTAEKAAQELGVAERAPKLAQLVAASPVEAAIHDAYGKVLGESSYNLLGPEFANHDLAHYLNADFGASISIATRFARRSRPCRFITWWAPSIR